MVAWQAKTGANTVVIVDEAAAHDAFMQQVYQLAAPRNIKVLVAENEQFRQMLQEQDGQKAIILFKGPTEAWEALHELSLIHILHRRICRSVLYRYAG